MTTTTEPIYPVPLRQFLEAGCDPLTIVEDLDAFADEIISMLAFPDDHRTDSAFWHRAWAEEVVTDRWYNEANRMGRDGTPRDKIKLRAVDGHGWRSLQEYVTTTSWTADMEEDPDLIPLLLAHMSESERATLAQNVEAAKHPHRLMLKRDPKTQCGACGSPIEAGELRAEVDDSDGIEYCFACIAMVYEAMKAERNGEVDR